MSVSKIAIHTFNWDGMTIDEMSVGKITLGEMSVEPMVGYPSFLFLFSLPSSRNYPSSESN